jgi:DnaJ-class molecular chaperone
MFSKTTSFLTLNNFKTINIKSFSAKIKQDPYLILEINRTADWKAIKIAYFKLARIYHPDMNKNDEVYLPILTI